MGLTRWEDVPIFPPFRPLRGALLREAFEGWDGMRYPCAWLSTLTPGHIQRAAAGQTRRGETPVLGPAAVNAKAERCRVARQGVADASAQGCVRPLARGRPVTPGPPRRNPWHGALGAPPPRIGGGEKEGDYGPIPAPAPSLGTMSCVCWAVRQERSATSRRVGQRSWNRRV